jgi:hypothetical protein
MVIIIIIIIIINIRQELGLLRPVSAWSNSLFLWLSNTLHPFGLKFNNIFATLLLFMVAKCRSQFYLAVYNLGVVTELSQARVGCCGHGKWVPVSTAWSVFRLWVEEPPTIWRAAANVLSKQSWAADKGWSSSLGVRRAANNFYLCHVKNHSQRLGKNGSSCLRRGTGGGHL